MDHEMFRQLRGVNGHTSVPFAGERLQGLPRYQVGIGHPHPQAPAVAACLLCPGSREHCQETAGLSLTMCGNYQDFSIGPPAPPFSQPGQKHLMLKGH